MRLLIAGCGYVGTRLAHDRVAAGDEVHALRRTPGEGPPGARSIVADLTVAASLQALPDFDAVVFAPTPDARDEGGYVRTYVAGAENLARAVADRDRQCRWIHVSSTSVFEVDDGAWVDEQTPLAPSGFRARRLLESERVPSAAGIDSVVLRLGGIYGPGREGLLRRIADGSARATGRYTNRIHRDDAAGAIGCLLDHASPRDVYLGADRAPAADEEVIAWIARRMGVPVPPSEPLGRSAGKRCRSDALVEAGFVFDYPTYRDGYGALLESRR